MKILARAWGWATRKADLRRLSGGSVYLARRLPLADNECVLIVYSRTRSRLGRLKRHTHRVHVAPGTRVLMCNCHSAQIRGSCSATRALLHDKLHGYRLPRGEQDG